MSRNQALTWCSDTLHSILGCSDSALALYLTTEAAKASSYNQILSILKEGNVVPINAATESDRTRILDRFAQDLYRKCHKIDGQSSRNAKKVATRKTNADWVKSAAKYDLLEDEGDGMESKASFATSKSRTITKESTSLNGPPPQITIKKESKRSRRRRRANSSDSSDGDYEHESVRKRYEEHVEERRHNRERVSQRKRHGNRSTSPDGDNASANHVSDEEGAHLTESQKADRERERDIKERDEFAKRLLERDKHKTKSTHDEEHDEGQDHQKRVDMEQRLARGETIFDEETGNQITLQSLREESRRSYLKKRKKRELTLLERELADEEEMFNVDQLTEAEKKRLELRKEVLKLAKGDSKDDKNGDFYRLPDEYEEQEGRTKAEKDSALLKSRYVEEKYEKTEQQLWEEEQTKKASIVNIKRGKQKEDKEYELVFEDKIDFVRTSKKEGYDDRKKKAGKKYHASDNDSVSSRSVIPQQEKNFSSEKALTKHEQILIVRKKLPVFPYREEFLAAVKDQQVLILVGETGSGKT